MDRSRETVEQKLTRNLERSLGVTPTREPLAVQQSLPIGGQVELLTITLDELHDLVYLAASSVNQEASTLSKSHAQDLAARAAMLTRTRATRHDGYHRGSDPRA